MGHVQDIALILKFEIQQRSTQSGNLHSLLSWTMSEAKA